MSRGGLRYSSIFSQTKHSGILEMVKQNPVNPNFDLLLKLRCIVKKVLLLNKYKAVGINVNTTFTEINADECKSIH